MVRKDATKLRKKFQGMDDHDVLIDIAVTQKFVESHLKELNGSVAKNDIVTASNSRSIASIEATCLERGKSCPAINPSTNDREDRRQRRFLIALVIIASASGALGANTDNIAKLIGLG